MATLAPAWAVICDSGEVHPSHLALGQLGQSSPSPRLAASRLARLWPTGLHWTRRDLAVPEAMVQVLGASAPTLESSLSWAGLYCVAPSMRQVIGRTQRDGLRNNIGARAWARLQESSLPVSPNAVQRELGKTSLAAIGAALLTRMAATYGPCWHATARLRLPAHLTTALTSPLDPRNLLDLPALARDDAAQVAQHWADCFLNVAHDASANAGVDHG